MTDSAEQQILVIGVGNPLMLDDGLGPRVIELLRAGYEFPENVEVLDAGTMGFMILNLIHSADQLIVVDAIKDTNLPPGTVLRLTPEQMATNHVRHSGHDIKLIDVLQAATMMGGAPETIAIGVQIEKISDFVLELTPMVEAAVPIAAAAVIDELRRLGVEPKPSAGAPDVAARIIEAMRTYRPMPDATKER
ncbi:MAG: hydrogenase maturation protease [Coriobacteriia bacterium]|nr:hydrogenase maturation protease [Coriobacteriia bacterium]